MRDVCVGVDIRRHLARGGEENRFVGETCRVRLHEAAGFRGVETTCFGPIVPSMETTRRVRTQAMSCLDAGTQELRRPIRRPVAERELLLPTSQICGSRAARGF